MGVLQYGQRGDCPIGELAASGGSAEQRGGEPAMPTLMAGGVAYAIFNREVRKAQCLSG